MRPQSPRPSKQTYVQFSKVVGPQSILKYLEGEGSWRVEFEKKYLWEESQTKPTFPISFQVWEVQEVQRLLLVQCVLGRT